jgi:cell division septum initiation protein DivIVA
MADTIGTVLAAQEKARATVATAREAARQQLAEQHARAQVIVERNAGRSLRAIRAFEKRKGRELQQEIAGVERHALEREKRFLATCEQQLEQLVDQAFQEFWPRP